MSSWQSFNQLTVPGRLDVQFPNDVAHGGCVRFTSKRLLEHLISEERSLRRERKENSFPRIRKASKPECLDGSGRLHQRQHLRCGLSEAHPLGITGKYLLQNGLLGAPIGSHEFCNIYTKEKRVDPAKHLLEALRNRPINGTTVAPPLRILQQIAFASRVTPPLLHSTALASFDAAVQRCLEELCTGLLTPRPGNKQPWPPVWADWGCTHETRIESYQAARKLAVNSGAMAELAFGGLLQDWCLSICPESARAAHPRPQENIWQTDKLPNFCLLFIHQLEAPEASSCEQLISFTPTTHTPHPVLPTTSAAEQAATHIPTEACIDDCRLMTLKSVWYVCTQGEISAKLFHRAKALIHAE